jgi:outer membrane protein TolC
VTGQTFKRRRLGACAFVLAVVMTGIGGAVRATTPPPLDAAACVAQALRDSALVQRGDAQVQEYLARLQEIEAVYYPKLTATAFVAPVFSVKGSGFQEHVERRYRSIADWGPYTSLEMLLAKPLYTFGRAEAGQAAARARADVERARLRETRNKVALETRRMYYFRLYALSMLPALRNAETLLDEAQAKARELFEEGDGAVTEVDLAKLAYGTMEVKRYRLVAENGADLALGALKHSMGLPESAELTQADSMLPDAPPGDNRPLVALLQQAAETRPEWDQAASGKRAAIAWEKAERLAIWPTVFAAGTFSGAYTPNHDADQNPWHFDFYNRYAGGVAVGLKFDVDPALANAKARTALATGEQVAALRRFAATGIPLQVRQAHMDVARTRQALELTKTGVTATRKWMTFAGHAYASGIGEAREVLEGLSAYLQAKRTHYETLQAFWVAQAELTYALGLH